MHRVLAVVIALLLGGGVLTAIVKNDREPAPLVQPTPTQTFTFDGVAPTESPTESPVIPQSEEPTASPTETFHELPRTGGGSFATAALLTLGIALAGGAFVRRAARPNR